ncbi:hypothetical protein D915_000567 [Fasciola hepatica]|uniref:Uncharacterized protein n=1 Tax=Fasciola hepatica TaxID=6192 RepID=A0A4E0RRH1_FASHE|nr:hypothetical protein D915_000567 [Fasciola hepatica]
MHSPRLKNQHSLFHKVKAMALVRKGLALRNNFLEHEVREMNKPLKKQGITPRRVTKSEKYPFEIYVDPIDINCQHCGSARSGSTVKPACKPKLSIQVVETATQTESDSEGTSDLKALLCNENPPEKYWEELAEQRRLALKETLDENQQVGFVSCFTTYLVV